jgi:crotonobetainyl-CoA:carnitine CoA-transferase CaiB-like acyl-CoA transferase
MRYDGAAPLPHEPSEALGASNGAVLSGWLGLSQDKVDQLAKDGVI